ncbi:hypothetical protein ELQ36_08070 [Methylococcus capsulatus]|nr:hypothetical protein [Methylococcus capsulatus]
MKPKQGFRARKCPQDIECAPRYLGPFHSGVADILGPAPKAILRSQAVSIAGVSFGRTGYPSQRRLVAGGGFFCGVMVC